MSELASITYEDLSKEQKQTCDLINAGCNVYIQGSAGSGKSTFIQYLQRTSNKNIVLTSSTGTSALNIGGVTLHSFFLLPVSDFIIEENLFKRNRKKVYEILKDVDMIIIDEVSMVRPDMLDAVDLICKRCKGTRSKPFGGIQVVLLGDLYQLPPVVKFTVKDLFLNKYGTSDVYFFDSDAYKNGNFQKVEFSKIYRQSDIKLLENLNNLKNKTNMKETLSFFNNCKHLDDNFERVTITPYKDRAELINRTKLDEVEDDEEVFEAITTGSFDDSRETNLPAPKKLILKRGALVMFTKNNGDEWVNGSTGIVDDYFKDKIMVKLTSGKNVYVSKEKWENREYITEETKVYDPVEKEMKNKKIIKEEITGTYIQYPLQLGYAITIHKVQGKTLDKVDIDLTGGTFTHGQLYVALSRTRKEEDMNIIGNIYEKHNIISDRVNEFFKNNQLK